MYGPTLKLRSVTSLWKFLLGFLSFRRKSEDGSKLNLSKISTCKIIQKFDQKSLSVKFDKVSFRYDPNKEYVLDKMKLAIERQERREDAQRKSYM